MVYFKFSFHSDLFQIGYSKSAIFLIPPQLVPGIVPLVTRLPYIQSNQHKGLRGGEEEE